jgi:predicted type IV restriction endonuclease
MTVPEVINQLISRFEDNLEAYRSGDYNEAQLRSEFLDPFFEALGWDIYNKQGYTEAYKDVIHEDSIKMGGATKAPDYAFRTGGMRS